MPLKKPNYWMYETSGQLALAVVRYVGGATLSPEEIRLIRAYLWQWVDADVWVVWSVESRAALDLLRTSVRAASTQADLIRCVEQCSELGMDPL